MPSQRSNNRRFILFIKSQLNFFGQKFVFHFEWRSAGNHPHQSTIHSISVLRTLNRDQYLLFISFPMNSSGILDSHKECPMCSNSVQLFI